MPLDAAEDHVDAEMGAQVNASAHLPEEHNRSLQQDQDESAPAFETPSTQSAHYVVKCNPCSSWGEHLCLTYEGKGKERKPVGNALPSGVQAIAGEGDCPMHDKSGFDSTIQRRSRPGSRPAGIQRAPLKTQMATFCPRSARV